MRMEVYIASPLGFSEAGRAFYHETLLPMLKGAGYAVLDPWALTDPALIADIRAMPCGMPRIAAYRALNQRIGKTNTDAIDRCDAMLAVLDGVDIDSGTAAEVGYAYAKGKPIVGYRGDFRLSSDNEAAAVNLQVEYFIIASGGEIVTEWPAIARAMKALHPVSLQTVQRVP
jgi:nucleoside 2-deoxyribosyltransferase